MTPQQQEHLRRLPAIGALLEQPRVAEWLETTPRPAVVAALREAIEQARNRIFAADGDFAPDADTVVAAAERLLRRREVPSLVEVINATGIVLHTGLGRAPLSEAAVRVIAETAGGYCNLEFELAGGHRGNRQQHLRERLCRLTGAESATVVNNNAAATLLILTVLAAGREVVVSRGQLIEIGGSFRLPDILEAGGAILREVGTTNRTRITDYEAAVTEQTALLLRVHTSNYRVVGFTEDVVIGDIAALAHRFGLIAVDDLGSGSLFDLRQIGLPHEPVVSDSLAAGADLVCFSGDKLLGGPQCGIICGRKDLIGRIEAHPLMRTYRVGKLTLLALEATLRAYEDPAKAVEAVPTLAALAAGPEVLAERAETLQRKLAAALPDESFLVCSDTSFAGGGSLPTETLETVVVRWRPADGCAETVLANLRVADPPVVARIRDDTIILDVRTVPSHQFDKLVAAVWDSCRVAPGE